MIRVLYVEDNIADRLLVTERLKMEDFSFIMVDSLAEVRAALATGEIDVVLSDYHLGSFDGLEVLEALRATAPAVPLVFVTITGSEEIAVGALKAGAADYVLKTPTHLRRLRHTLLEVVERARRARQRESEEAERLQREQRMLAQREVLLKLAGYRSELPDYLDELHRITEAAAECLQVDRVSVWRYDEQRRSIHCVDLWERPRRQHTEGQVLTAADYPGYFAALAEAAVIAASSPYEDPRTREFARDYLPALGITAMLDVPIRLSGAREGVLCHEHVGAPRQWQPDEESFAVSLGNLVALAVERAERRSALETLRQAQKMEALGQLAAGVAHDFNNLLAVIKGHIGLMGLRSNLSPELTESTQQITRAADRAAEMTRHLLTFGRQQPLAPSPHDLNSLVADVSKMLRRLIGENVSLEIEARGGPLAIQADAGMVEQVLLNLVVNARDAMPRGGTIRLAARQVAVDAPTAARQPGARAGTFAVLSVSDTGTGIPLELLPHIFEPFFTTKPVGQGTGLGLATVYGIMVQHGGWITLASEPGRGTTFHCHFPLLAAPTERADIGEHRPVPGGSETILLVEDDESVRTIATAALTNFGYRVLPAADGPEALGIWARKKSEIALLFTDSMLPKGLSGPELAKRLCEERPGLNVLFTTGYSPVPLRQGSRPDSRRILQKPYELTDLARAIRDCLDHEPFDGGSRRPFGKAY